MQDFNGAQSQYSTDLIPDKTVAKVIMTIRAGNSPLTPWATPSQNSDAHYLDCEFVVLEGEYAKRRFWSKMTIAGGKPNESGNSIAGEITRARLKAILESARGVLPTDTSPQALAKRRADYGDFNGLEFAVKIKIKRGGVKNQATGELYKDANDIDVVITPDMPDYARVMAGHVGMTYPAPQNAASNLQQAAQPTYSQGFQAAPAQHQAPNGHNALPSWGQGQR